MKCLQIQLDQAMSKNDTLEKTVAKLQIENTSKDNLNESKNELEELKKKFENFKNNARGKVNPKITQQLLNAFNLIPQVPLKLLFHLNVPYAEKSDSYFNEENSGHKICMMAKESSKQLSPNNQLDFKLQLKSNLSVPSYELELYIKATKPVCIQVCIELFKVSLNGPENGKKISKFDAKSLLVKTEELDVKIFQKPLKVYNLSENFKHSNIPPGCNLLVTIDLTSYRYTNNIL